MEGITHLDLIKIIKMHHLLNSHFKNGIISTCLDDNKEANLDMLLIERINKDLLEIIYKSPD